MTLFENTLGKLEVPVTRYNPFLGTLIAELAQRNPKIKALNFAGVDELETHESLEDFQQKMFSQNREFAIGYFFVTKENGIRTGRGVMPQAIAKMQIESDVALVCFEVTSGGILSGVTKELHVVDLRGPR